MPLLKIHEDVELYYDEFGSGDKYLLSGQQMHSAIKDYRIDLADHGFHVFNIQIRGYGRSSHVTEDYGMKWYDIWSSDIIAFADKLGIDKFFYSGVSHGAGIGWTICRNYPDRLTAFLGVVAGPHSKDGKGTGAARMATIEAAQSPETWILFAENKVENIVQKPSGDETAEQLEILSKLKQETYDFWVNMKKEEAIIDPKKPFPDISTEDELIAELAKIQVPTLLLGGMDDPISLPENILRSCKAVKNSKMVLYEGVAHNLSRVRQAEVVGDILNFCRQKKLI